MATMASTLLRAACNPSLASRAAAATATMASRCPSFSTFSDDDYEHVPDDVKTPTDKDLETDEAVWAVYERWCKALNKKRDHAEMVRRFKIFRYNVEEVHSHNTYVPDDPEEAAILLQKRREAELLLSKGQDVSRFDDCHLPEEIDPLADGGDTCLRECDYELLKMIEKREVEKSEARRADKNVTVE